MDKLIHNYCFFPGNYFSSLIFLPQMSSPVSSIFSHPKIRITRPHPVNSKISVQFTIPRHIIEDEFSTFSKETDDFFSKYSSAMSTP